MQRKIIEKIIAKCKYLAPIDLSWCDSLAVEDEKFNNISLTINLNDFNYITYINLKFYTENPPGFIYTGKIKISDFNNKKELETQIKKQTNLANNAITDAKLRAAQINIFE